MEEGFFGKKMPRRLVEAVMEAREANRKFSEELKKWYRRCQREKEALPRERWVEWLRGLANGIEMDIIFDNLQFEPRDTYFLATLESMKANGFPEEFLNEIIEEINPVDLPEKSKQILRKRLNLQLEEE